MSKITLEPNNSGTGTFTIAAPNSNTNRTLNLPDEAGTALTDATDLEPQVKTATNATGSAPIYACRAWVNFDGTGTISIRDSGNVSSITDRGTGRYTVNFATDMPDSNYSIQCNGIERGAGSSITGTHGVDNLGGASPNFGSAIYTTSAVSVFNKDAQGAFNNSALFTVAVFR